MLNPLTLARFPLWPVVDGRCGCGSPECPSKPGKHPRYRWRQLEAGQQLQGLPGDNYGIATGDRSGVFVVDLDGDGAIGWWEEQGGTWDTYMVQTSRGAHLYFQCPEWPVKSSQSVLAPCVDVRGQGGMVVAPGAVHSSGHVYEAVDPTRDALPAPEWLLQMEGLRATIREVGAASASAPVPVEGRELELLTEEGRQYLLTAEPAVEGAGGSGAMWSVALHLVRTLCLPLDVCVDLIEDHYNARCTPPWSTDLLLHKLEDARDKSDLITCGMSEERAAKIWAPGRARRKGVNNEVPEPVVAPELWPFYNSFIPGQNNSSSNTSKPEPALPVDVANVLATDMHWTSKSGARCLRWNTFNNRLVAFFPPVKMDAEQGKVSDADVSHVRMWLSCHGKLSLKEDTRDAMYAAAKRAPFHPIIDYLETCRGKEGDCSILDDLAAVVLGSAEPLAQEFLKKTLVAAVRRIYHPGTRVDTVLTLVGKQGAKKTTFVQVLFGEEYVRSQMPDLSNKDASIALQDFWAVELGELHRTLKTDHGTVKEFLSRTYDDFRPPHGICDIRMARHNVFIGTANEDTLLSDATGNRRFLPIAVQKVDIEFVRRNRDQIWAAALVLAEDPGYQHWFEDESVVEPAHEDFIVQDPWHNMISAYCCGRSLVTNEEVFKYGICGGDTDKSRVDMTRYTKSAQMQIADTLKRLGCKRRKNRGWTVARNLASANKMVDENGASVT
jgi:predicted P-loop ATPase